MTLNIMGCSPFLRVLEVLDHYQFSHQFFWEYHEVPKADEEVADP